MAIIKAYRFKRSPEAVGGLQLQDRDIEIIRSVYSYRFLNSEQIQALVTGSKQVTLRRLQKLFHHGYLDRPISQIVLSNPLIKPQKIVYGLGDKGADLLAQKFGMDRGKILWKERNKQVRERYISHTLMISNFRACLSLALKSIPRTNLLFWMRENSQQVQDYVYFREGHRQRRLPINPDGFFAIENPKAQTNFFLEADRSTMSNPRFLNKMRAYWLWWKQKAPKKKLGIDNFRVLTLTISKQRKDNLIRVTQEADDRQKGSSMFWFATEQDISLDDPKALLQPIWRTAATKDQKLHSLLE